MLIPNINNLLKQRLLYRKLLRNFPSLLDMTVKFTGEKYVTHPKHILEDRGGSGLSQMNEFVTEKTPHMGGKYRKRPRPKGYLRAE